MAETSIVPDSIVFVVDDDESMRESLARLFRSVDLQVKTFKSAADFLLYKAPQVPACMVLDVRLPGLSGLDFQADLARSGSTVPIIFMTGHGDIPMTVRAMEAGAAEFLSKPFRDQEMLDAVQAALEHDRSQRDEIGKLTRLRTDFDSLTPREREIMGLVASGLMNKQIASELGLSEITVKVHRANVMKKMSAKTLAELVRMADALHVRRVGA
jgi:FixJ family two-component response regulator